MISLVQTGSAADAPDYATGAGPRPRGVLADDHAIVTDGLRRILEPEYAIVAVVTDGEGLLAATRMLQPDFVVTDVSMPGLNGIDAIRLIKKEFPNVHAICLTAKSDRMFLAESLAAGASGFLGKQAPAVELRHAIRTVLRGGTYVSPLVGGQGPMRGTPFAASAATRAVFNLTARQRQVLQLVAAGHTAREIGSRLKISSKTVECHKARAMESLGLTSSAELIQFAMRHGLTTD